MTGGVYVTQDKARPKHTCTYASLQNEMHTHRQSYSRADCVLQTRVSLHSLIICASTHLPKSFQAKSDLTFSDTESAEKVG